MPLLRTVLREPLYAWNLWRGLKDVDVAHIFSASYTSFLLAPLPAWLVARMRAKKTLINYRSGEARDHLQRSRIARRVLQGTDELVVPSGYLVEVFRKFGLTAQIVPNIIDLSQFKFRIRRPLRPHLICTRGFHPYYGIDVVVRAFAEVQRLYPDAQLDLVGGGTLEGSIRDLVEQLNLSNVNFAGSGIAAGNRRVLRSRGHFCERLESGQHAGFGARGLCGRNAGRDDRTRRHEVYRLRMSAPDCSRSPEMPAALAKNILRVLREPELAARLSQNAFEESSRYRWTAVREQWLRVYARPRCHESDSLDRAMARSR